MANWEAEILTNWEAEILTNWIGSGIDGDTHRPAIGDDYQLKSWSDVTGQPAENLPTNPNLYAVRVVCDEAVMADIQADANYQVIWSKEIKEDTGA